MTTAAGPIARTFRLGKPEDLPSVDDAVDMHQAIAEEQGLVALGKTGKALATQTIERALDSEKPAILLLTRSKDGFHGYRAKLKDILSHPAKPREDQVPRYYRHLMMDIRSWLMIGPLASIDAEELERYCLCSNKRPLLEVLRSTRTANMLVYAEPAQTPQGAQ
jgi:hypothetical protein